MSEEKLIWNYHETGLAAGKSFRHFNNLMKEAIKAAPCTVKFTSPDIEKLQKEIQSLKEQLKRERECVDETEIDIAVIDFSDPETIPNETDRAILNTVFNRLRETQKARIND